MAMKNGYLSRKSAKAVAALRKDDVTTSTPVDDTSSDKSDTEFDDGEDFTAQTNGIFRDERRLGKKARYQRRIDAEKRASTSPYVPRVKRQMVEPKPNKVKPFVPAKHSYIFHFYRSMPMMNGNLIPLSSMYMRKMSETLKNKNMEKNRMVITLNNQEHGEYHSPMHKFKIDLDEKLKKSFKDIPVKYAYYPATDVANRI